MKLPRRQPVNSAYRPPRRESRGAGPFRFIGAVIDWPVTVAGWLFNLAVIAWERWPRWLSIPVIAVCAVSALYLLVLLFWWLTFSDPVTGES